MRIVNVGGLVVGSDLNASVKWLPEEIHGVGGTAWWRRVRDARCGREWW